MTSTTSPQGAAPPLVQQSTSKRSLLDEYRLDPNSTGDLFPEQRPAKVKRKVLLAVFLLAFGSACIIAGVNVYFHAKEGGIPLLVVGSFAFLPGFYHTRIAYLAYKGTKGFSMDQIPDV